MILDMAAFGLKAWPSHLPMSAPDASPWFERAKREGAMGLQLHEGVYRCDSPVDEFNFHIYGEAGCGIIRNFPADSDTQAMFTLRNLYSGQFKNVGFASSVNCQRNGVGTGALIALIPRSKAVTGGEYNEQVTSSKWESVNFTSAAAALPWPHPAYHKHNFYCDGTLGGTGHTTHIRTMTVHDCTFFGTEHESNGGSSLLLKGVSSCRLTGGGITWSGGRAAITRIDGGPGALATGNCFLNPNGMMKLILQNCNKIQIMAPTVEGDVVRGPNANGIWGVGHLDNNGKLVGSWNNGTGAVWQDY